MQQRSGLDILFTTTPSNVDNNGNILYNIGTIPLQGHANTILNSEAMLIHRRENVLFGLLSLAVISNTIRVWNTK